MVHPKGESYVNHTKTLMEATSRRNQLSPVPMIGKGFGKRFEAPSYEEGVGVDGRLQPWLQKGVAMSRKNKSQRKCWGLFYLMMKPPFG
jgi:hypothetical protein